MSKYLFDTGSGEWRSEASFDTSTFRDVEIVQQVNEILDANLDPLFVINIGGSIYNKAVISDGIIYFGCMDKKLYALSVKGELAWTFETGGVIVSFPCLLGGLIIFGSYDHNLYALDKKTGRLVWKFPAKDKIFSGPCTDGSRIFFGSRDGNFYCLSAEGRLLWRYGAGGPIETHPLVNKGVVYFGSTDQNLYALRADTGAFLWKFRAKAAIRHGFALWDDVVFFNGLERMVYGVNAQGRQVFSFTMNDYNSNSLFALDGVLYVPSRDKHLYAVRTDGKLLWKFMASSSVESPVASGDVVLAGSCDQNLYALDKATGRVLWKFPTGGIVASTPVVHEGVVFVGGWDCNFYALDLKSGKLIWKFRTSIGTQSGFDMDAIRPQKHFEVVWRPEAGEKELKKDEARMSDYALHEDIYATGMSRNYIKGKKGYV